MFNRTRSQKKTFDKRINRFFFKESIKVIQAKFRNQIRTNTVPKMAFILNPYDQTLDLLTRDHLRLYTEGCAGLPDKNKFDGKIENYPSFVKLIGKKMEHTRTRQCLKISTEWENTTDDIENPVNDKIVDVFDSNRATKDQVDAHCALIWSTTDFAGTNNLFKRMVTKPTDDATLNAERNPAKLKHAMLGNIVWNSLTPSYQLEIVGEDEDNFRKGNKYDGVKLWCFIQRNVNPSTTTGATSFKEAIESAKLSDFGYDVKAFNTWFTDQRKAIIKEEGEGMYNEYTRSIFKTYLTSENEDFNDSIKAEKRDWTLGKKPETYTHKEVMKLAITMFNNLSAEKIWTVKPKKTTDESKFLALTAQVEELEKKIKSDSNSGSNGGNNDGDKKLSWRFQNPNNEEELRRNDKVYKWCKNDCHRRPMWCNCPNCMNRADYKKHMESKEKNENKEDGSKTSFSDDFRVALAAITTPDDYKALENQFFSKAGK